MKKSISILLACILLLGMTSALAEPEQYTFPLTDEKITLNVMIYDDGSNWADNWFTNYLEEKTNVHIEWSTVPVDAFQEKKTLKLNSGNLPDLIVCGGDSRCSFSRADEVLYGSQGLLLPLNDLIDKYGVGFAQVCKENPALRETITTPDGNIYALPSVNACYHCSCWQKLWINQTWLDNLGLQMPTTTDELEQVLIAFRDQDANGNGDPNDEIPMSSTATGRHTLMDDYLMNAFIPTDGLTRLYLDNGTVKMAAVQDAYREGLRYLNRLYEEKLIYPESFTQDQATQVALNESGDCTKIGCIPCGHQAYFANYSTPRWTEYVAVPPIKGPEGVQATWDFQQDWIVTGAVVITTACKYPEIAFKMCDYLYTPEGTMYSVNGLEGVNWVVPAEGALGLDGNPAKWESITADMSKTTFADTRWDQTWNYNRSAEFRAAQTAVYDPLQSGANEVILYNATKVYREYVVPGSMIIPNMYFSEDVIQDYTMLQTLINSTINESSVRFITGDLSIDNDWDAYVNQLNDQGLQEYLDIVQKTYYNR